MYGSIMRHAEEEIIPPALSFAKEYLGIFDDIVRAYTIHPFKKDYWAAGWYCRQEHRIFFNGFPNLNTIFHEAVHYWQAERGEDMQASHEEAAKRYNNWYEQYWNRSIEVEARAKAEELEEVYTGIPCIHSTWTPWPFDGLKSDHTYYRAVRQNIGWRKSRNERIRQKIES